MTTVAARYDVSSNYLARVRQHLNVPYPHRGYCAKQQFGKASKRPPLPGARPGEVLEWAKGEAVPRPARPVAPRVGDGVRPRGKASIRERPSRHQPAPEGQMRCVKSASPDTRDLRDCGAERRPIEVAADDHLARQIPPVDLGRRSAQKEMDWIRVAP